MNVEECRFVVIDDLQHPGMAIVGHCEVHHSNVITPDRCLMGYLLWLEARITALEIATCPSTPRP